MDDDQIQARIEQLEDEERALRADENVRSDHPQDPQLKADAARLAEIKVELDQLWDLKRQRRALRSAGDDPDKAAVRDPGTVENYLG